MPDSGNNKVFGRQSLTRTAREVPGPGMDSHAEIKGGAGVWNGITNSAFFNKLPAGQEQELISTADHVIHVQNNQIVRIQQAQATTATQEITITSTENQVYVKAATKITLEVGNSRIIMAADGKIQIVGVEIAIMGDLILTKASEQNIIIGGRVDINPPA
ncbi:MAG: hypothetical protein J2P21_11310 [Chloracidobacterium sp.]|nr:hypothetical protein [Chloracidobacterium sp.]